MMSFPGHNRSAHDVRYDNIMERRRAEKLEKKKALAINKDNGEIYSDNPSKAGSASDKMAQIIRAEWDDYEKRFQPYDQQLIDIATNKPTRLGGVVKTDPFGNKTIVGQREGLSVNDQAIQRARGTVADSFNVAQGTQQRNNQRLGLSFAADELTANNRNTKNNQTLSELSAINGTRMHTQDRSMSIMAGDAAVGLRDGRLQGGE